MRDNSSGVRDTRVGVKVAEHCVRPWWEGGALEIDLDDHSQRLTLDIVTSLAFNKSFMQVEGIDTELNGTVRAVTEVGPAGYYSPRRPHAFRIFLSCAE